MRNLSLIILALVAVLSACKKDDPVPPMGTLEGNVTDAITSSAIPDVTVILFDASTNEPVGSTMLTDADGFYTMDIEPGSYYVRAYAQGYAQVPAVSVAPLAFEILDKQTTINDFSMFTSDVVDGGYISGKVTDGTNGIAGTLVVADDGTNGYSTFSDQDGNYVIYNVAAGNYTVNGWVAGYNTSGVAASVTANMESTNVDLSLTNDAAGSVSGSVTFLATENAEVDVALVNEFTNEAIPGLNTFTSQQQYTISDVPNGTYLARASYANDGIVVDPDWIVKNGEPYVTVSGSVTRDFSVTNSVTVDSPSNPSTSVQPTEISTTTPTFTWLQYSSASDYVIEVTDASGKLIWGGFADNYSAKNVTVPSGTLSVDFGDVQYGSAALEDLVAGKVYRWRVYASKNDAQSPTGWRLISVSEDQMGLFIIIQ